MPTVVFDGISLEVDNKGFLKKPEVWDRRIAEAIARSQGMESLGETHWSVILFIRKHFETSGKAPLIRAICKECEVSLRDLYKLFPKGPVHGACKIAGLDKPDGCV
jgi:TusE/DsrC/DsvC family sulfur relay protein